MLAAHKEVRIVASPALNTVKASVIETRYQCECFSFVVRMMTDWIVRK